GQFQLRFQEFGNHLCRSFRLIFGLAIDTKIIAIANKFQFAPLARASRSCPQTRVRKTKSLIYEYKI
ncbi:hypothetical protein, partial [Flavobacterium xanthum]|uniref:hypothetical protein n=1 Tax=Flavobacterium xanthum TaxID=69322 RepID=UPI001C318D83